MQPGRPSRTAAGVARRRAVHQLLDRPLVFEDPLAIPILGPQAATALRADPRHGRNGLMDRYLRAFVAARSRIAEDRLRLAVARGARQYVVLGAGLDTFAYRNPHPGLRVFEVDHPATQAWKRERLAESGIEVPESLTFVPIDFQSQTLADTLSAEGLRAGDVTFFSWLGVVPYVARERVLETLRFVATTNARGSEIVFDYGRPARSLGFVAGWAVRAVARRVAKIGEPWVTFFDPPELAAELRSAGFANVEDFGPARINSLYFPGRGDGLAVGSSGHVVAGIR